MSLILIFRKLGRGEDAENLPEPAKKLKRGVECTPYTDIESGRKPPLSYEHGIYYIHKIVTHYYQAECSCWGRHDKYFIPLEHFERLSEDLIHEIDPNNIFDLQ